MTHRNPFIVFLLPFVTFGIYSWYWLVVTKNEMNRKGEHIPTAWLWLIPFIGGIWWLWTYAQGVEHVTQGKMSGILVFLLFFLFGSIGHAIVQDSFNAVGASTIPAPSALPQQPGVGQTTVSQNPPAPQQPQQTPPPQPTTSG